MKRVLVILLFAVNLANGQKLPDDGTHKVRIVLEDRTIQFEVSASSPRAIHLHKWYFWYSANQVQSTQGGFSGKLLDGYYRSYYLNKNLMEEGGFRAGLKDGVWKTWTERGVISQQLTWDNGVQNGNFYIFDTTGRITRAGRYRNGLLNGDVKSYSSKDSVTITYYKNGKVAERRALWKKLFGKKKTTAAQ